VNKGNLLLFALFDDGIGYLFKLQTGFLPKRGKKNLSKTATAPNVMR